MRVYNIDDYSGILPQRVIEEWEKSEERVIVVSQHNTEYLAGLLRQIGLPDAIMIGDNMVRIGIEQPPDYFVQCKNLDDVLQVVRSLLQDYK